MKKHSVWVIEWHDGTEYVQYSGFTHPFWSRYEAEKKMEWLRWGLIPKQRFRVVRYDRVVGG